MSFEMNDMFGRRIKYDPPKPAPMMWETRPVVDPRIPAIKALLAAHPEYSLGNTKKAKGGAAMILYAIQEIINNEP